MMGRNHVTSAAVMWLAGCAAASAVGIEPSAQVVILGTPLCAASALLPDLDHQKSVIARSLGPVSRLLAWGVSQACGHRGLTHTAACAMVVGLAVTILSGLTLGWSWWWLGAPVAVGCLTHILGDCLTISGCPLLWPLPIRGDRWRMVGIWKPMRFRTGKWVERTIVAPLLLIAGIAAGLAVLMPLS